MIHVSNLSVNQTNGKVLFDRINLTIEDGDNLAIIGPSGCGKSTILRYILGILFPISGCITIDGKNMQQLGKKDQCQLRLTIGMMFQSGALFDSLNVEQNIAFPLVENTRMSKDAIQRRVNDALSLVDLNGYNKSMPYQLSGGQKKRIGIARAIITNAKYLFMDEPTAGLDPLTSATVEDMIVRLSHELKTTTVIVSHEKNTILRTAKKIYMIHNHGIIGPETPETILSTGNNTMKQFVEGSL